MANIAQEMRFEIDLRSGLMEQPQRAVLMRGDRNANRIVVVVTQDGKPVDLSGVQVSGRFIRPPDGAEIPLSGTVSGGEAAVTLIDACYANDGRYVATVSLKSGDVTRTILTISGQVMRVGSGAIIDVGDVIPNIDDIIAQYEKMQQVTATTQAAAGAANTAAGAANTAAGKANTAAIGANSAAKAATDAAGVANAAAEKIDGMTATAEALPAGSAPTVQVTDDGQRKMLAFGIPRGNTGEKGNTGATPQITFTAKTGEPGTQVQVSQGGTPEQPTVNLTIPRGMDGKGSVSSVRLNGTTHQPDGAGVVDLGDVETPLSDSAPAALGRNAAPGVDGHAARGDHVHPLPTAADVGAYPAGAVRTAQISIAASAWAGSGPYNTVLRISGVTAQTDCRFDLGTTLTVLAADVAWETGAGTITMTTTKKPTGELAGRVILMEVAT